MCSFFMLCNFRCTFTGQFYLLIFELLCAVLISAIHSIFLCKPFTLRSFSFSTYFLEHFFPFYPPLMFFSTLPLLFCQPVLFFFFQSFCLVNCLLAVSAAQGLHPNQWLETQGCHLWQEAGYTGSPSIISCWPHRVHSLPVASYTGFPFIIQTGIHFIASG